MLDLYLVRHGATAWSKSGQHTSRTDLPLLPEGEEEAARVGLALAGIRFAAVYSSDRQRAVRTARLAGFPWPEQTPLLREFDYGDYEGLTSTQIHESRPGWELYRDGCPGGEDPEEVYARARAFVELVQGLEGEVLVFSHGHLLRTLATAWTGLAIGVATSLALDAGAGAMLRDGDRGRVIQRWNVPPDGWGAG
jgi:broad specificity phosphatase PhoE